MRRVVVALSMLLAAGAAAQSQAPRIQVVANDAGRRVDISIDGQPFTSYIYPTAQKKPSLYPLRTAHGGVVTRGWPLEPRPNERIDHPHHVGLWFNYGDVNGLDFWNNSNDIGPDRAPKMGTIIHKRVVAAKGGKDEGQLDVEMDWVDARGTLILTEATSYVFRGDKDSRTIDRITKLTAAGAPVVFGDNKEGLIGMRLARSLEQPVNTPDVFTDASGKETTIKVLNNEGVTGEYTGSDGKKGDKVWGTRGPWTMLTGKVNDRPVTLAIFDHPSNPGHPTYWHARGYGLFAANNLGSKVFDPSAPEARLTVKPGESITFRHRILILDGAGDAARMTAEQKTFRETK